MSFARPSSTFPPFPGHLSLTQFLQTVFVGITGLPGPMVRPKWQKEPPKQEELEVSWMAMGIDVAAPDANAYLWPDSDGFTNSQRHETLDVGCAIYGPHALEIYGLIRDGFQIPQNLETMRSVNMGFVEVLPARQIPDFFNERFIGRIQTSVILRHEILRIYPVPTVLSASGTIHTVIGDEDYLLNWETPEGD